MSNRSNRTEREIASLGFEIEVTLVWRSGGEVRDERRGFKRWVRQDGRSLGQRGVDVAALFAWDSVTRSWRQVWKSTKSWAGGWPTHFVQLDKNPPAPKIDRPVLEEPAEPVGFQLEELERRAVRAFQVDRALPDREKALHRVKVHTLQTTPAPGDYPTGIEQRDVPNRKEVEDWQYMLALVAKLKEQDVKAGVAERRRADKYFLWRSCSQTPRKMAPLRFVAERMSIHEDTVRAERKRVLRRLADLAECTGPAERNDAARPRPVA